MKNITVTPIEFINNFNSINITGNVSMDALRHLKQLSLTDGEYYKNAYRLQSQIIFIVDGYDCLLTPDEVEYAYGRLSGIQKVLREMFA